MENMTSLVPLAKPAYVMTERIPRLDKIFNQVSALFNEGKHLEEFQKYREEKGSNGVGETARYFFFIAREVVLKSQEKFRKFNHYLELYHGSALTQLYKGKKVLGSEITPVQVGETNPVYDLYEKDEERWWNN